MTKKLPNWFSKDHGFTLIELLVAIVIMGILGGILISTAGVVLRQSRDSKRQTDLRKYQAALEQYNADQGYYPAGWNLSNAQRWEPDETQYLNSCQGRNLNSAPCTPKYYLTNGPVEPLTDGTPQPGHYGWDHHYCYVAYKSSQDLTNRYDCDNNPNGLGMCHYYELAANLESLPLSTVKTCEDHFDNFKISPSGP